MIRLSYCTHINFNRETITLKKKQIIPEKE